MFNELEEQVRGVVVEGYVADFVDDDQPPALRLPGRVDAEADETGSDMPYEERQGGLVDPFGHKWVLTQTVRDVDPSEWGGTTVVSRR